MANKYWSGGAGTWSSINTANWSDSLPVAFTGSRSGNVLTTTGSPALQNGMSVRNSTGTVFGIITGGSGNSWTTTTSGTITSQAMSAAIIGASVPTAIDDVFFDAYSNMGTTAFTVTMSTTPRVCRSLTINNLDGTMTLAGSGIGLTISGSLSFPATNFNRTYSGTTTFNATTTGNTITTNGKTLTGGVTFSGSGGDWTLGSALDCGTSTGSGTTGTITHSNGTFGTGGYAVTASLLLSTGSAARTLNLNNSNITLANTTNALQVSGSNFTFNAGTSVITFTNASTFNPTIGLTYYNLILLNAIQISFTGTNTFNRLTIGGNLVSVFFVNSNTINVLRTITSNSLVPNYILGANQTINEFELGSSDPDISANRIMFRSNTLGVQRSIAMTTITFAIDNVDFRDIAITGITQSGTRLGDCGGNNGITFDAPKTVYYSNSSGGNWNSASAWSNSIGGTPNSIYFPLPQDTVIFTSAYPAADEGITITANYNIGTIDASSRSINSMVFIISGAPTIYGNWNSGTAVSFNVSATAITFAGRETQTINTSGVNFANPIAVSKLNNTLRLISNSGGNITLNNSTLDLNGYTWTCSTFTIPFSDLGSNLTFNGGTLEFTGTFTGHRLFTTTQGTGTGRIVASGSSPVFIGSGGNDLGQRVYNCTLQISSTYLYIGDTNYFTVITNTVSPLEIIFQADKTTTVGNWNVSGTLGNLVTIRPSDSELSFQLSKASGIVSSDYLNINSSNAAGGATWYAGANSINGDGYGSGWIYTAAPAVSTGNFFLMF